MRGIWGKQRGRWNSCLDRLVLDGRYSCVENDFQFAPVNAMAKKTKNVPLDADAVKRGEQYSKLHNTNVSQLVNRFLSSLPVGEEDENKFSPTVRRLIGIAPDGDAVREYHEHLLEKYDR
jgi:hypothetical protein